LAQGPASQVGSAEAAYLKGYVLAYGQLRFKEARDVLRGMVNEHAKHPLAPLAQKALADSFYWQGDYPHALEEYARLRVLYGSEGWGAYALYQSGQCLLLQRKDGDALAVFRDAAEKYPGDPMSDAALLRVAEVYRMLDDDLQARDEFQHVLKVSKEPAVRSIAMDELESIEHDAENLKSKGVHSP
jgi:TolA-binding protein